MKIDGKALLMLDGFFSRYMPKRRNDTIRKAKIYLKPTEKPPKGLEVKRGPKGGLYYESKVPLPVERAPVPKFKDFPSELANLTEPKRLYETLLASKSAEGQLGLAYEMWAWYKEHKGGLSPEGRRAFNAFHRSINQKIRHQLKKDFEDHVGKPKISAKAKKIHDKLKSEPHKEVKTASEQFIASIVPEGMRVKFERERIKENQEAISKLTLKLGYPNLSEKFDDMLNEKNACAFLIKSENLLKDLDEIDKIKVTREISTRIGNLRRSVVKDLDWAKIYNAEIMKDRTNEYYAKKTVQSMNIFNTVPGLKLHSETTSEVREMAQEAIMKISPELLEVFNLEDYSINVVDKGQYYMAFSEARKAIIVDKTYFPKRGSARSNESSFKSGFLHELTHLYEVKSREFRRNERALFNRRTKFGHIVKGRAWGSKYDTYKDRWRDSYMGRVYDRDSFEMTSTTLGSIVGGEYGAENTYAEDPEMFMFAKESMLDGRFEQ